MSTRLNRQFGFAALVAIFLVVVLAALGGFMVSISNAQQRASTADLQGTRAYWAARSGLDWGLASVRAATACPAASTTLTVQGFSVVVTCVMQTYAENGLTPRIFQLTAVATLAGIAPGSVGYIDRSVSASLEM